jgi:hypothetical protein
MPRHAELRHALVSTIFQILTHILDRKPGNSAAQRILGKGDLALHRLAHHLHDFCPELVIEQVRLFLARGADDLERERHVSALVAENPIGAGRQAMQQTA